MTSTSHHDDYAYDSDVEFDLRDQLDACTAARAALREVASSASAEREMALEALEAVTLERDKLRREIKPLKSALAEATKASTKRDDELQSLKFKSNQLLRHARDRDKDVVGKYACENETEEDIKHEEHVYIEAMATVHAAVELELIETREALRLALEEALDVQQNKEKLERMVRSLKDDNEELKARLEKEIQGREGDNKRHASDVQNETRRAERAEARARAAEEREEEVRRKAELRDEVARKIENAELIDFSVPAIPQGTSLEATNRQVSAGIEGLGGLEFALGNGGGVFSGVSDPNLDSSSAGNKSAPSTVRAFAVLAEHQKSIQTHIQALQRDRDRLVNTFGESVKKNVDGESLL